MKNLIKKKMVDLNRDDFVNYLSEILGISRQTAGNKLNGCAPFTTSELTILVMKLGITKEELYEVITHEGMTDNESDRMCKITK